MPHLALLIATLIACLLPKTSLGQPDQWVTNADVMKLVAAGVDDNTVIAVIEQARLQKFDVGPEALNALRASRVPETVITAMQRISSPSPAAPSSPVPISGQAYSLVGLTEDQLRTRLRAPTTILNGVWYFDSDAETLRVYVTNGVVSEVHPADFASFEHDLDPTSDGAAIGDYRLSRRYCK